MLGIELTLDCPSCGNIFKLNSIVDETPSSYKIPKHKVSCGCGRTSGFNLLKFEQREVKIFKKEENENEN